MFASDGGGGQANRSAVYQIDFTAVASGKRIASSKRRVRWRFGFANMDALAAGQTGTDCRGEEHDVTIVWSITSGKKVVLADGKEVHHSKSRNNVFDFSWTIKGNHVLKVVAHAQPPMTAMPGFRQYDFFVDGQSFFTFPKVFRLGLAPNDPRAGGRRRQPQDYNIPEDTIAPSSGYPNNSNNSGYNNYSAPRDNNYSAPRDNNYSAPRDTNMTPYVNGGNPPLARAGSIRSANSNNIVSIEAPHNPEEEDAYLRQAIENSLKENPSPSRVASSSAPPGDNLLLDFMTPAPASAGHAPVPALPPSTSQYPNDIFGAPSQPGQHQPAFAALPPSTTQPPSQQQQMVPVGGASDPWGMASMAATLPPSQAAVAQPAPNPYGVAAQAPFPTQTPTLAANQDPFGMGATPSQAGGASTPYGVAPAPFGSPPPSTINAPTPATQASSIGFASPMAQPFGLQGDQQQPQQLQIGEQHPEPVEPVAAPSSDPALLSMNVLSGQPQPLVTESMTNGANGTAAGSMADQAYAKLVNMDAFDLVQSKDTDSPKNPFDAAISTPNAFGGSIGGATANTNASLADMRKGKKPLEPKKSIMNTPAPAPGAMVLSNNQQQGNFGGYGGLSAGMGNMGAMGQQQGNMGTMGQQQPTMGQPPAPPQMQGYGGMQQQQAYGQPPQQAYGMQPQAAPMQQQPSYGMQPQQQGQYGQPPPVQQQQTYGQQPPPLQQQPSFQF